MSRYSASVTLSAHDTQITRAIYESIKTDDSFYPENPVSTSIAMPGEENKITITAESENAAHLRANLNSTLRLIQASHASIAESVGKDSHHRTRQQRQNS